MLYFHSFTQSLNSTIEYGPSRTLALEILPYTFHAGKTLFDFFVKISEVGVAEPKTTVLKVLSEAQDQGVRKFYLNKCTQGIKTYWHMPGFELPTVANLK